MTVPPRCADPEQAQPYFAQLRQLAEQAAGWNLPGVEMNELSMGMSGDFAVAIAEGATLIRIGSALFGGR
ncbi:hypothetical protein MAIT1_05486 [Magnetofaba australis IT-1]|uniref:Uncharacterized protein n=1 Tax=Magnetofaba australis IT-1 TaxID=1434232 RepID=A0A1Y2K060_9PROT|nr:alanine racemase [Magnetofaba australis]OSM00479.1 hypothetical protein MAIT1_05486 [Magnetofaba australis IT-1]